MGEHDYFQLVPPLIVLLFAAGFLSAWRYDPTLRGALPFGLSYAFGAVGLTMDFATRRAVDVAHGLPVNALYLVATALFAAGLLARFRLPPIRWVTLWVPVGAFALYAMMLDPSFALARTWLMHGAVALMMGAPVLYCWKRCKGPLARILLGAVAVTALQYVLRMGLIVHHAGAASVDNYGESLLGTTTRLASSIGAMCVGTFLLMLYAMDVVRRLTRTAERDPLTELMNRRGLTRAVAGLERSGPGAVVVADLDRFKSINDAHGHAVGDAVIATFGSVLGRAVGRGDLVARIGGEEFAVVLPRATLPMARLLAEGARVRMGATPIRALGARRATASFGVAAWNAGEPLDDALARADRALYGAKAGGRNRVMVDGGEPPAAGGRVPDSPVVGDAPVVGDGPVVGWAGKAGAA